MSEIVWSLFKDTGTEGLTACEHVSNIRYLRALNSNFSKKAKTKNQNFDEINMLGTEELN